MRRKVQGPEDLESLEVLYRDTARFMERVPAGTEEGLGEALRIQDQWGVSSGILLAEHESPLAPAAL